LAARINNQEFIDIGSYEDESLKWAVANPTLSSRSINFLYARDLHQHKRTKNTDFTAHHNGLPDGLKAACKACKSAAGE